MAYALQHLNSPDLQLKPEQENSLSSISTAEKTPLFGSTALLWSLQSVGFQKKSAVRFCSKLLEVLDLATLQLPLASVTSVER